MTTDTTTTTIDTMTTDTTTRGTKTRWRAGIAAGAMAVALTGTFFTGSAAFADEDPFGPENLQRVCNNEPTGQTMGMSGTCTFEVQGQDQPFKEWLQYGSPISNCNPGAISDLTEMQGQVRSFSETWTAGGGVGLELWEVLKLEASGEYSQTRTTTTERRDTVIATPGYKNALTAGTEFVNQTGRIRVDVDTWDTSGNDGFIYTGTEPYYIEGVTKKTPTGNSETGQDNVPCNENFKVPA